VTIVERLEPVTYGIDPERLAAYEQESRTLARFIAAVENAEGYMKVPELKTGILKWLAVNYYVLDSRVQVVKKLATLGVLINTIPKSQIEKHETSLGSRMIAIHNICDKGDDISDEIDGIEFDNDGDCVRSRAIKFVHSIRNDYDVAYIISLISDPESGPLKNPSPPMKIKLGLQ
jgi:hypothetical protein